MNQMLSSNPYAFTPDQVASSKVPVAADASPLKKPPAHPLRPQSASMSKGASPIKLKLKRG